ncbi:MAG: MASE1 domain-containing protein [Magnetococcales bacterium]|nr:MASE1 domain-containing protein [Magnetococcales bacterium]
MDSQAHTTRSTLHAFAVMAVIALAYVLSGRLGLAFSFFGDTVTLVWPPTGISLAALLLLGWRYWPGVLLGALLVNIIDLPPAIAAAIAVGNTLEAVIGCILIKRGVTRFNPALATMQDLGRFLVNGAFLATMVSATVGVSALCLGDLAAWRDSPTIWWGWWLGDAMGAVTVGAFLLAWFAANDTQSSPPFASATSTPTILAFTGIITLITMLILGVGTPAVVSSALLFAPVVGIGYSAWRYGPRGATTPVLAVAAVSVIAVSSGAGPFHFSGDLHTSLLHLYGFLGTLSISALALAVSVGERTGALARAEEALMRQRHAESQLRKLHANLEEKVQERTGALKQAQQALQERSERALHLERERTSVLEAFRQMVAHSPIPMLVVDGNTSTLVFINDAFTEVMGYGMEEIADLDAWWLLTQPDADERTRLQRLWQARRDAARRDQTSIAPMEITLVCKGGNRRIFRLHAAHIADTTLMLCVDLTEVRAFQKEIDDNRKHLIAAQRLAHVGSWQHDMVTDHLLLSHETRRIFGLGAREPIDHDRFFSLVHPDDRRRLTTARRNMVDGKTSLDIDYRLIRTDGEIRTVHERAETHLDTRGTVAKLSGVVLDITDRRHQEQELLLAKRQAEQVGRAKDLLLMLMSHEIRTPMSRINTMAERLAETPLNAPQRHLLESVHNAGGTLLEQIDAILDLASLATDAPEPHQPPFSPATLLEEAVETQANAAEKEGITLHCTCEETVPKRVSADRRRLDRILNSVIGNAVTGSENGTITVTMQSRDQGDETALSITVQDAGIGISAAQFEAIFHPFTHEGRTAVRHHDGIGIGLILSRLLAERMGGTLTLESAPGTTGPGTTVTVTFPAHPVADPQKTPSPMRHTSPTSRPVDTTASSASSATILIVEDSEDNRLLVEAFLKTTPYRLRFAHNGEEGVRSVQRAPVDLVLMDIQMPVMDGLTATRAIRAWEEENDRPAIPILALTAHTLSGDRRKSLEAGCDEHLSKPISKKSLLAAIRQALDPHRSDDDATRTGAG